MVVSVGVGVVGSRLGLVLAFGGNGSMNGCDVLNFFFFFPFNPIVVVVVVGMCRKHIILMEYITK